ncbi:hypothetical protein VTK56DRAFT_9642 [Thermocarpiscus australiensis]
MAPANDRVTFWDSVPVLILINLLFDIVRALGPSLFPGPNPDLVPAPETMDLASSDLSAIRGPVAAPEANQERPPASSSVLTALNALLEESRQENALLRDVRARLDEVGASLDQVRGSLVEVRKSLVSAEQFCARLQELAQEVRPLRGATTLIATRVIATVLAILWVAALTEDLD